ncbi:MAG TPA: asparaginase [Solirubrobacteraceae bacterium]
MTQSPYAQLSRPVRLLAAGGTIAMSGERAVPALDAGQLIDAVPGLGDVPQLEAENVLGVPGPQMRPDQALGLCRRARDAAAGGEGVVITTGTDTLEELAMLCALLHGGEAPIVLTGANRPASRPGADGPANLLDAVAVAGSARTGGLGSVVVFGGEIHAACSVRKVDSTGPAAFGSPVAGPIGRVVEGRVWLHAIPAARPATLDPQTLEFRVEIVTAALGEDGAQLRRAAENGDGVVIAAFGAGHVTPGMIRELRALGDAKPVLVTCRPERASMLFATYGFDGAEPDLRATPAVGVPFLSPVAARIALLCGLGAGLDSQGLAQALSGFDAG